MVAAVGLAAHAHDAHLVAVLLAEQRHGAGADRRVAIHQPDRDRIVLAQEEVDLGLDRGELGGVTGLGWLKSKRSRSGATSEPFWVDVVAEMAAQRRVQQVGRRVRAAQARAALGIDRELDRVADRERAALEPADVDVEVAASFFWVSVTRTSAGPRRIVPVSPIWPPDSP